MVISLPEGGLAAGMYTFSLEGEKYTVDGKQGENLQFTIYVDAPAADKYKEFTPTVTPSTSAIQTGLKTIQLTFNEGDEVAFVNPYKGGVRYSWDSAEEAAAKNNANNWFGNDWIFGGCFAEGNMLQVQNSASNGLTIPSGKNTVWVYFEEGIFTVNGEFNKPFTLKYYVGEAPEYFDYDAEPAAGSTTWSLDFMSLEFFDVDTEEMTFELAEDAKGQLKRNGAVMENYDVLLNVYENFLQMMVVDSATQEEAAVMEPGHYQVVIPAGSFFIDGLGNSEISLAYEIAYQEAEFSANP